MKLTNKNINEYVTLSYTTNQYGKYLILNIKNVKEPRYTSAKISDIKKALGTVDLNKIRLGVTKSKRIYIYTIDKYSFIKNIKYIWECTSWIEQSIEYSLGEDPREDFFLCFAN